MSRASEPIARHELVAAALALGIERPDELSTEALTEAIARVSEAGEVAAAAGAGGWFAVARHLVTSVVEQGLNLPTAARMLRTVGGSLWSSGARARPPLPTVTLAQIYMQQGYDERARATLTQVLERQPDHPKARQLIEELDRRGEASQAVEPPVESISESSAAEPSAAEPSAAEPSAAEPSAAEPSAAEPSAAEPSAAEPSAAEPSVREQVPMGSANGTTVEHDVLVALLGDGSARLAWQLGPQSEQLVADQGVEMVVRVVSPRPLGPEVCETRHPVSAPSGIRSFRVPSGAALCAALYDVQGAAGVLGVAAVFDASGQALPGASPSPGDTVARDLAVRLLQAPA